MKAQFLTLIAAGMVLSACGGSDDGTIAHDKIDRDAWRASLTQLPDVRSDPDLDTLERVTREQCATSEDELAIGLTLVGARADTMRVNMRFICPSQTKKLDAAVAQVAELG